MSGCPYKNIFGAPGTGAHSYRLFNVAVVDVVLTVLVAWAISWLFRLKFWQVLVAAFLLGIVAHQFFCVRTTVDKMLFKT